MLPVLSLVLMSSQFTAGGAIPSEHTCEGADKAPALHWSGVPASAKLMPPPFSLLGSAITRATQLSYCEPAPVVGATPHAA